MSYFRLDEAEAFCVAARGSLFTASVTIPGVSASGKSLGELWPGT